MAYSKDRIRVKFDSQIFLLQRHGGIRRYFTQLINTFWEYPELGILPIVSENLLTTDNSFKIKMLPYSITNTLKNSLIHNDIIHFTFYLKPFYFFNGAQKKVSTLHDMIPETTNLKLLQIWNPHFSKKFFINNSDLVLCVSESSFSEMKLNASYTPPAITVTPLGSSMLNKIPAKPRNFALPKFILYVGKRSGYKNWITLPEAIRSSRITAPLVLVGGGALTRKELKYLSKSNLINQVYQLSVTDSELAWLYKNCEMLISTSLSEGFSLPPLEALSMNCKVVCTNIEPHRNIGGPHFEYFEPKDHIELGRKIHQNLLKAETNSFKNPVSGDFSWFRCAELTSKAYHSIFI